MAAIDEVWADKKDPNDMSWRAQRYDKGHVFKQNRRDGYWYLLLRLEDREDGVLKEDHSSIYYVKWRCEATDREGNKILRADGTPRRRWPNWEDIERIQFNAAMSARDVNRLRKEAREEKEERTTRNRRNHSRAHAKDTAHPVMVKTGLRSKWIRGTEFE
jgi:hypothetical protein